MSILEELGKKKVWEEFRASKQERGQLTVQESRELDRFVEEERYVPIADSLSFGLPVIRCPACDSTDIKELEGDERERIEGKFFIKKIFYDDYECLECGHRW